MIQTDGFVTKPVIYSILDSEDSVHYFRLGRFFTGIEDPDITSKIPDSIYFKTANLKVTLQKFRSSKRVQVPVEFVTMTDKEDGMFTSKEYGIYQIQEKLIRGEYPYKSLVYDSAFVEVAIPGLPVAKCSTSLVWPPKIWWPIQAAQFIFIYPENPMRVLWSGDAWNEIDVNFQILEQYPDSTVTQTFFIQKTNDIHWNGKYYEIKVPYELIVQMLEQKLIERRDVIRRYFGAFRIDILTGNQDFDNFIRFKEGINDFNYNPYFNIENGIGMICGKSSTIKMSMHLDQASRLKFAVEPSLRKFKIIEY